MTPLQVTGWLFLLAAFYVICAVCERRAHEPSCPICGGRREHTDDCDWRPR